jgi:hypothetical protein
MKDGFRAAFVIRRMYLSVVSGAKQVADIFCDLGV